MGGTDAILSRGIVVACPLVGIQPGEAGWQQEEQLPQLLWISGGVLFDGEGGAPVAGGAVPRLEGVEHRAEGAKWGGFPPPHHWRNDGLIQQVWSRTLYRLPLWCVVVVVVVWGCGTAYWEAGSAAGTWRGAWAVVGTSPQGVQHCSQPGILQVRGWPVGMAPHKVQDNVIPQ